MWQVSSKNGKSWVRYEGGRTSTSADMAPVVVDSDRPVEIAPMSGEFHSGRGELGMFLRARNAVGWPHQVTGKPPAVPGHAGGPGDEQGTVF